MGSQRVEHDLVTDCAITTFYLKKKNQRIENKAELRITKYGANKKVNGNKYL